MARFAISEVTKNMKIIKVERYVSGNTYADQILKVFQANNKKKLYAAVPVISTWYQDWEKEIKNDR